MSQQSIRDIFYTHNENLVHKWDHYLDIYEAFLGKYRNQNPVILEIGISHGGSLQMWKKYFGKGCKIYAIDINPECKKLEEEDVTIFIGSQDDQAFLNEVITQIPELDFVIDDGGHFMTQQITSFEMLFHKVKQGGLYIVEDTHTSYWPEFGGGVRREGTFMEFAKNLVDALYNHHVFDKSQVRDDAVTNEINAVSFFDSVVIFNKKMRPKPFHKQIGSKTITPYQQNFIREEPAKGFKKFLNKFKRKEVVQPHPFEQNDGDKK